MENLEILSPKEEKLRKEAMQEASQFITKHREKRCKDFEFGCFICEAWFAFDRIFQDPTICYKITPRRILELRRK